MPKTSLGICIGASTISYVKSQKHNSTIEIISSNSFLHEGNPKEFLTDFFSRENLNEVSVVVTGRKFKELINTHSVAEPKAIEAAIKFLKLNDYDCIASLGGENFIIYYLDNNGKIENVITGNKCASGTGEFFLQQIGRMDLSLDEASKNNLSEIDPYLVSGRCSVFCKSDCTHALNKGIDKGRVVAGLSKMIAEKAIELLSKHHPKNLLLIGGVSSNDNVVQFIREKYESLLVPDYATSFEALGASLIALENDFILDNSNPFKKNLTNFSFLEPLNDNSAKVTFKEIIKDQPRENDICILGLDVGSTTTKAVLIRVEDNAFLASVYLRTNGNPVLASLQCYEALKEQVKTKIKIIGLGTTGSGRHIAALHAMTKGIINEIIAHSVAAAFFDKEVDTIFEIGGQDAKYTYLTNGIASDYAMNEACSAGTGSFLEEAARESLNVYYRDIGEIAFLSKNPLNFNDQCAAFISSDIKSAGHDGFPKEDIVAGLVYSICMNFANRVKGSRPVGKKIFMQGGVCYNRAVPYAMSNLVGKEIIVPPEPGLMGAFGVALEIKNRINLGLLEESEFDFDSLINRKFNYVSEFVCAGGKEKCDRKCAVSVIEVDGKKFPFGGACNKYYNERLNLKADVEKNDYVKKRQDLVFNKYLVAENGKGETIGITKSFYVNSFYPLYYNFFASLGLSVVLSDDVDPEGVDKIRSSFCYPVEISHGFFENLRKKNLDYIFLPHVSSMKKINDEKHSKNCVFVQGESYYIKAAFQEELSTKIISPVIDFSLSFSDIESVFVNIGETVGINKSDSKKAFAFAFAQLEKMNQEFKLLGKEALDELAKDKSKFGVVLFGRSYNSFVNEANLNIPQKFASKNLMVIPYDFLDAKEYNHFENMYWFSGQQILKTAQFVKEQDNLFGAFITNFSCGPDSFIIPYFRKIMGTKPSLTLELDSHSADVGIDTRIDAAIDIIRNYNELKKFNQIDETKNEIRPLKVINEKTNVVLLDNKGNRHSLNSKNVEVVIPSMGKISTEAFAAMFRSMGVNCKPLNIPTNETLKQGRGITSCKECLPYILTTGSLVEYITANELADKKVLFFMPHGYGPCRQGQYYIMLQEVIKDLKLENVAVLTMNEEASFDDLGKDFFRRGWIALMISDVLTDIYNALLAIAEDKISALKIFDIEWKKIEAKIELGVEKEIFNQLKSSADELAKIKLKTKLKDAKTISLIGEIYVRKEEFSLGGIIEELAERGFVVRTAPISEYIYYSNYLLKKKKLDEDYSLFDKTKIILKDKFQNFLERKIKRALSKSNLVPEEMINIDETIAYSRNLISEELVGEGILTTGLALREILDHSCGVISIGPFNCMPCRLADSILNNEMTLDGKHKHSPFGENGYNPELKNLPFLYVETDGSPFPQIIQSRLEIFMMQAEETDNKMKRRH